MTVETVSETAKTRDRGLRPETVGEREKKKPRTVRLASATITKQQWGMWCSFYAKMRQGGEASNRWSGKRKSYVIHGPTSSGYGRTKGPIIDRFELSVSTSTH